MSDISNEFDPTKRALIKGGLAGVGAATLYSVGVRNAEAQPTPEIKYPVDFMVGEVNTARPFDLITILKNGTRFKRTTDPKPQYFAKRVGEEIEEFNAAQGAGADDVLVYSTNIPNFEVQIAHTYNRVDRATNQKIALTNEWVRTAYFQQQVRLEQEIDGGKKFTNLVVIHNDKILTPKFISARHDGVNGPVSFTIGQSGLAIPDHIISDISRFGGVLFAGCTDSYNDSAGRHQFRNRAISVAAIQETGKV